MATITPDTTKVRAGDYIDIRYHPPCPVSIARTDDGYLMTWHDGNPDTKSTTAVAIIADMIGRGTLVLTASEDEEETRYRDLEAQYDAQLNRDIRDHYAMLDAIDEERNADVSRDEAVAL